MKMFLLVVILAAAGYWAYLHFGDMKAKVDTALSPEPTPDNTAPLVAADLAGYNGKALRKSVNALKEANDQRNGAIDKRIELNSQ